MRGRWTLVLFGVASLAGAQGVLAQSAPQAAAQVGAAEEQLADDTARAAAQKEELVQSILATRQAAAGRVFSARLRATLSDKLRSVALSRLEAFHAAGGLGDIAALAGEFDPDALGDSAADLLFTPVAPCRIINTTVAGGAIAANTTRSFFVNGATAGTFENQGGKAGGCGIPDDATSVEMNFIAVGPSGAGDFRAFPFSATPTPPLASVLNYANVAGLNIANGLAQPVCNAATTTCTFDLIVQADVAASHLIVDVVGYFRKYPVPPAHVASTVFNEGPAQSTGTTAVTIVSTSVTVTGPGKIIAIGSAEAFCDAGCAAGTDFVSAFFNVSTTAAGSPATIPRSFFFAGTNQSNSVTRTLEVPVASAGTYTLFLRGARSGGVGTTIGFYRGQLQLFFLPN